MHYFLLGCSVMALSYLSAEGNIHFFQKPRFISVKTGRHVMIYCVPNSPSLKATVEWFKGRNDKMKLQKSTRIQIKERTDKNNASISIRKVNLEDNGIYFCKFNETFGPGTQLQVSRYRDNRAVLMRSRVKDVVIFLQAFLLILCIVVPLVQIYKLDKKEDAVYEEPENDHIYEGLEIERCGGDLYEDISVYAQTTDAAWEVESPDQE